MQNKGSTNESGCCINDLRMTLFGRMRSVAGTRTSLEILALLMTVSTRSYSGQFLQEDLNSSCTKIWTVSTRRSEQSLQEQTLHQPHVSPCSCPSFLLPIRPAAAPLGLDMHDARPTRLDEPRSPLNPVLHCATTLARLDPLFFVPLKEVFQSACALHDRRYGALAAVHLLLQVVVDHAFQSADQGGVDVAALVPLEQNLGPLFQPHRVLSCGLCTLEDPLGLGDVKRADVSHDDDVVEGAVRVEERVKRRWWWFVLWIPVALCVRILVGVVPQRFRVAEAVPLALLAGVREDGRVRCFGVMIWF